MENNGLPSLSLFSFTAFPAFPLLGLHCLDGTLSLTTESRCHAAFFLPYFAFLVLQVVSVSVIVSGLSRGHASHSGSGLSQTGRLFPSVRETTRDPSTREAENPLLLTERLLFYSFSSPEPAESIEIL